MEFKRITADLSPEAYETLSQIAKQLETSKAEALRRALGLTYFILRHQKEGGKVILEDKEGKERQRLVAV